MEKFTVYGSKGWVATQCFGGLLIIFVGIMFDMLVFQVILIAFSIAFIFNSFLWNIKVDLEKFSYRRGIFSTYTYDFSTIRYAVEREFFRNSFLYLYGGRAGGAPLAIISIGGKNADIMTQKLQKAGVSFIGYYEFKQLKKAQ